MKGTGNLRLDRCDSLHSALLMHFDELKRVVAEDLPEHHHCYAFGAMSFPRVPRDHRQLSSLVHTVKRHALTVWRSSLEEPSEHRMIWGECARIDPRPVFVRDYPHGLTITLTVLFQPRMAFYSSDIRGQAIFEYFRRLAITLDASCPRLWWERAVDINPFDGVPAPQPPVEAAGFVSHAIN